MIRALIIDDEESGEQLLSKLIKLKHPDIKLVPSAFDLDEAIQRIDIEKPNLIFLDIRLGKSTGFDVLEKTVFQDYHVIFVTAYSQYALKAIKSAALDYLLKPVDMEDLDQAINRFKSRVSQSNIGQLRLIKAAFEDSMTKQKLVVPTKEGFEFIDQSEIKYIIADENYARIFITGDQSFFSSKNLGYFEKLLPESRFSRIHKSHLVNLNSISNYEYGNGGFVKMIDGKRLEVSRRRKKYLLEQLNATVPSKTDK
ncbi:LytR/AlgR family response regulator transcription factor [Roseivirga sp.]|uniref:LytR/AlgR family response regulator transcription factor n=1 Tax=Roseivirga sp. TaxID=1964215 RepID=UPI003B8C3278